MKKDIWEKKFSDNFKANFFIRIIQKLETNRKKVILSVVPEVGEVFVDLACGDGDLIQSIASRFKKIIGFDIARNRIINSKKKNKEVLGNNLDFKVADLDKGIPLKNNFADVAVCEASLSYFYDVEFLVRETHRILKKGGCFIVQVPNYAFLPRRIALLLGKLPKTSSFPGFGDGGALHYFTYHELRKLLMDAGFEVTVQTNSGVAASFRKLLPSLLASDIILKSVKI